MRVTLEVKSGTAAGHKRFLRAGESLEVGRSGLLDFAFADDREMSGRHFRIVTTANTCHIEDLESSNGTQVNGQKISRQPLQNNDKIAAGNTRFAVHVEGATHETVVVEDAQDGTVVEMPVTANYVVEACKSGLQRYKGSAEATKPAFLTQRLSQQFQQVLIVNMQQFEEQTKQVGEPEYLFDWLPEETRAAGSPWMVTGAEAAARAGIVDEAWGKDAMVCVYSEKDEELPLDQLKRCAGTFARPSVLRPQLSETVTEVADDMMLEIEAVLVEDETPESWLLFTSNDLEPLLAAMGLKKTELEKSH